MSVEGILFEVRAAFTCRPSVRCVRAYKVRVGVTSHQTKGIGLRARSKQFGIGRSPAEAADESVLLAK